MEIHNIAIWQFMNAIRVVIEEESDSLVVPASALFRSESGWAVFVAEGGRLQERIIEVSANNGIAASVLAGLSEGETIVLYPSAGLAPGTRVTDR